MRLEVSVIEILMIFFFSNCNYYFQDVNLFYIVYHACPDSFEEDSFGT